MRKYVIYIFIAGFCGVSGMILIGFFTIQPLLVVLGMFLLMLGFIIPFTYSDDTKKKECFLGEVKP